MMDFIRLRNKGTEALLGRLSGGATQRTRGMDLRGGGIWGPEIQGACMRLGVPVALFAGLLRQSVTTGFFQVARDGMTPASKAFPFQTHHLPPEAVGRKSSEI